MVNSMRSLVSTHLVCEELSVMQKVGPVWRFCCRNHTEYPILGKEYTHPPRNGTSHGLTLGKSLPRISPPQLELLMADLGF